MSTPDELSAALETGQIDAEQQTQIGAIIRAAVAVVEGADTEASHYQGFTPVEEFALDTLICAIENDLETYEAIQSRFANADWSPQADGPNATGVYAERYISPWRHDSRHEREPDVNCPRCPLTAAEPGTDAAGATPR